MLKIILENGFNDKERNNIIKKRLHGLLHTSLFWGEGASATWAQITTAVGSPHYGRVLESVNCGMCA